MYQEFSIFVLIFLSFSQMAQTSRKKLDPFNIFWMYQELSISCVFQMAQTYIGALANLIQRANNNSSINEVEEEEEDYEDKQMVQVVCQQQQQQQQQQQHSMWKVPPDMRACQRHSIPETSETATVSEWIYLFILNVFDTGEDIQLLWGLVSYIQKGRGRKKYPKCNSENRV